MGLFDNVLGKRKKEDNGENGRQEVVSSHDIFISYSTKDHQAAHEVCHFLEQNNFRCWIAPRNIPTGKPYAQEINNAVKGAKAVVLIYSMNALNSTFVKNEIGIANDNKIPIVPFNIDGTFPDGEMELFLRSTHFIMAFSDPEKHYGQLFESVNSLLNPSEVSNDLDNHIYISYSSKDTQAAEAVCHALEKNGHNCWIAPRNILAGKNYAIQINDAVKNASMVVLIFSKSSMESQFVVNEITLAFENNKNILSFKIDGQFPEGDMAFCLKSGLWIDAYPDYENSLDTLIADVNKIYSSMRDESYSDAGDSDGDSLLEKAVREFKAMDFSRFTQPYDKSSLESSGIFISYDGHDVSLAEEICRGFESVNVKCWFKRRDYLSGNVSEITDAIRRSDLMIMIYSRHSKNSNYVNTEVDVAFTENIPIIVFRIDKSELDGRLSFFLTDKHWVDAYPNLSQKSKQLISDSIKLLNPGPARDVASDEIGEDPSLLKKPFKAYQGDKPFIFISYAHKDAALVFKDIKIFHDAGYPIWYDQGLTPGQEWDDEIALALMGCSLLVVFISKNSMASRNVQDEIKMALNRDIDIVPIYFERTELPPALELRLSNKHAIMKYNFYADEYIDECFKAFDRAGIIQIDFDEE